MEEVSEFLSAYFQGIFWPLHLILIAVTALLLHYLINQGKELSVRIRNVETQPPGASEVKVFEGRLSDLDDKIDLCLGFFVLVGLLGTIFGFSEAFPLLQEQRWKEAFGKLKPALSTSGVGIGLMILFGSLAAFFRAAWIERPMQRLREHRLEDFAVEISRATAVVARDAAKSNQDLALHLQSTLGSFTQSVGNLSSSVTSVAATLVQSAGHMAETSRSSADTLKNAESLLDRSLTIPGQVAHAMEEALAGTSQQLVILLGEMKESAQFLAQFPKDVRSALETALRSELEVVEKVTAVYRTSVEEMKATMLAGTVSATKEYAASTEAMRRETKDAVDAALGNVTAALDRIGNLPDVVKERTQEAADDMTKMLRKAMGELQNQQVVYFKEYAVLFWEERQKGADHSIKEWEGIKKRYVESTEGLEKVVLERTISSLNAFREKLEASQRALPAGILSNQLELMDKTTKCIEAIVAYGNALKDRADSFPDLVGKLSNSVTLLTDASARLRESAEVYASATRDARPSADLHHSIKDLARKIDLIAASMSARPDNLAPTYPTPPSTAQRTGASSRWVSKLSAILSKLLRKKVVGE